MSTSTIIVRDAINAIHTEPVLSWDWQGGLRCTAAMLIEERVRTEFDRVHSGVHPSAFFSELARNQARLSERNERLCHDMVARALTAFERGKVLLIVNDRQISGLDEEIQIEHCTEAVFLKLVPLQGG